MVLITNFLRSSTWVSLPCLLSLVRLGVGTGVWYLFAGVMFPYVEHVTGGWHHGYIFLSSHISSTTQETYRPGVTSYILPYHQTTTRPPYHQTTTHITIISFTKCLYSGLCTESVHHTKTTCYQAGHLWTGFDPSGHCFLLSWNNLFMVEEFTASALPLLSSQQGGRQPGVKIKYLQLLTCLLSLLMFLGELMMISTSLYFHSFLEKFIGTSCGLGTWYLLYQIFYPRIFYPHNIRD